MLDGWVRDLLQRITPPGADARTLDEITTTEVLDLAYIQGGSLEEAIAAHAIFPLYVEEGERNAGPASMSVTFPVELDPGAPLVAEIRLKWGQASVLQIGEGARGKVVNPRHVVPDELLAPQIGSTRYELREARGGRMRALAGPLRAFAHTARIALDRAEGEEIVELTSPAEDLLYASVDGGGALAALRGAAGELIGQQVQPTARRALRTYLWGETRAARVTLRVHWSPVGASRVMLTVTLRNLTQPQAGDRASAVVLGGLIMPIVTIGIEGGQPSFPPLQYAEAKRRFIEARDEGERRREATRRLYEVRQSGCIATLSPSNPTEVVLSTFGVFDTPRERPVSGPELSTLVASADEFLRNMSGPSTTAAELVHGRWDTLRSIILSAGEAFNLERLYRFQWEAIEQNLEYVAAGATRPVTVVRAPTGAGKTVVFMINAAVAALCGAERGSAVLMFPTRLLNEDMFRRLTAFVHALQGWDTTRGVTGGLLMGTSDPLYRVLLSPNAGEEMHHFGPCPVCHRGPMLAAAVNGRIIPECPHPDCAHRVVYMYTTYDVTAFLPDIVIATPDKLFYEATAEGFDQYHIGLFGAPVRRCLTCGRACPASAIELKGQAVVCANFHRQSGCVGRERGPEESRPIRYIGFDEVHSLYGVTATYLSMFLADLEALQVLLSQRPVGVRYETATATISNETALIEALTRRAALAGEIVLIPQQGEEARYFEIEDGTARHRVLVTLPTRITSKQAFIRATLNAYLHLRGADGAGPGDLAPRLATHTAHPDDWSFLLGYLFKTQEGADMRRGLRDMFRNSFGRDLRIEFLSGEAPKNQISQILTRSLAGEIEILLANLVISLGIDIHGLNHMIMMGMPQGFTEFVQTAGRTGRGRSSGHVHVILAPYNPRDGYLYRHLHAVLSDVAGYYDVLPVKSTNLFCAGEMFGNVAKSVLVALCNRPGGARWSHANGVRQMLAELPAGEVSACRGISEILCNDPELLPEVEGMVRTRFESLMDQLRARNGFLSELMRSSTGDWLIHSLRGRSGNTVRIMCADDALMERLRAPQGGEASEAIEEDGA